MKVILICAAVLFGSGYGLVHEAAAVMHSSAQQNRVEMSSTHSAQSAYLKRLRGAY